MAMTMMRWEVIVVPRTWKTCAAGPGKSSESRPPDGQSPVLQDEDQSHGGDEGIDHRLDVKGPIDEPLDDHSQEEEGDRGKDQGQPVRNPQRSDDQ